MSDLIGKTLSNRYQVLGLLGEGGMGGVSVPMTLSSSARLPLK